MADKTIGSLPAASALDDPSLLVVEQGGVAMKLAGLLLKQYCQNAVAGQVAQAAASATEAGGSAEDAEAWSVGKRNGVDVPSTDPAYHNNAKYYAEQGGLAPATIWYAGVDYPTGAKNNDLWLYTGSTGHPDGFNLGDVSQYNGTGWDVIANIRGATGADGVSPTVVTQAITGGIKIIITDKDGAHEFNVMNGTDGTDGTDGITPTIGTNGNWYLGNTDTGKPSRGATGATGATGPAGKSAYASAQDGGFTGTEAQFNKGLSVMGGVSGIDTTVTQNSGNLITSGAVYSYIQSLDANEVKY